MDILKDEDPQINSSDWSFFDPDKIKSLQHIINQNIKYLFINWIQEFQAQFMMASYSHDTHSYIPGWKH